MKTFVFANPKGGTGKSTTLLCVAMAFLRDNASIAILDLDLTQKTSWRFGTKLGMPVFRKGEELPACQVLLIDTPGHMGSDELRVACDYVRDPAMGRIVVAMQPSLTDLDATKEGLDPLHLNTNPAAHLLLTRVQTNSFLGKKRDELSAQIALPSLKTFLRERQCYKTAIGAASVADGWAVLTPDAQAEINALKTEILL